MWTKGSPLQVGTISKCLFSTIDFNFVTENQGVETVQPACPISYDLRCRDVESWTLIGGLVYNLRVVQRAMERAMFVSGGLYYYCTGHGIHFHLVKVNISEFCNTKNRQE